MRYETYEQKQARLKKEYEEFLQGKWHYQCSFKLNCEYCGREFYSKIADVNIVVRCVMIIIFRNEKKENS